MRGQTSETEVPGKGAEISETGLETDSLGLEALPFHLMSGGKVEGENLEEQEG